MAKNATSLFARDDRPLMGVISRENGEDVTRYFTDEDEADAASPAVSIRRALRALGAWKDLDWKAAANELDRIRHESRPTPPLDL